MAETHLREIQFKIFCRTTYNRKLPDVAWWPTHDDVNADALRFEQNVLQFEPMWSRAFVRRTHVPISWCAGSQQIIETTNKLTGAFCAHRSHQFMACDPLTVIVTLAENGDSLSHVLYHKNSTSTAKAVAARRGVAMPTGCMGHALHLLQRWS